MKKFITIIGIFVIFLEVLLFYKLEIKGVRPDFLFIVIFIATFYYPFENMIFPIWLLGLLKDIISQSGLGTNAVLYLFIALIISLTKQVIFKEDMGIQLVVLFLGAWLCNFCNGAGLVLFYGTPGWGYIIMKSFFIGFYTTLVGGFFLMLLYSFISYIQLRSGQF
jgi:rod shape-determining protein MreD